MYEQIPHNNLDADGVVKGDDPFKAGNGLGPGPENTPITDAFGILIPYSFNRRKL